VGPPVDPVNSASLTAETGKNSQTLSWSELTTDLLSRPLDSCEEVRGATLYTIPDATHAEVLQGLARDDLDQSVFNQFWNCEPTDCACGLADFSFIGHPLIPGTDFAIEGEIWLLNLRGGDSSGLISLSFLGPDADSDCTELVVDDATAEAAVHVHLTPDQSLVVPAGADIEVDWSALGMDGFGGALVSHRLDHLQVDRLGVSLEELSDRFLELDALSLERWELPLEGGTSLALADLTGSRPFEGIDADGTWLLTIWCKTCLIDLPRVAVVLEAGE